MHGPVFRSSWERLLGKTDSPIEGELLSNFCVCAIERGFGIAKRSGAHQGVIVVRPQHCVDRYRADFLISYHFFGHDLQIVVECDGHDFHEKTKAQARRDKKRDRDMQRAGFQVYRFTGSEIRANPVGCAGEVLDTIEEFQTSNIPWPTEMAGEEAA